MKTIETGLDFSKHSITRMAHRNLSLNDVDYVVSNGKQFFGGGLETYYLRQRDLPASDRRKDTFSKLVGTAVLISNDGTVVTTWRNKRTGLKKIRRKV